MNSSIRLIPALILCLFLMGAIQSEGAEVLGEEETDVTIVLTKFDVNDTNLKMDFKIINNTDHDIWICDGLHPGDMTERFLDLDAETLVIRRRFDLPRLLTGSISKVFYSKYIRLRPGHEKVDSLSFDVPVVRHRSFGQSVGNAENAIRVALEIGFYNEDLPGMILEIVEVAEKIKCDLSVSSLGIHKISDRFFGGWAVAKIFKYFYDFRESVVSGGDEVRIPYMGQVLHGEKILRITIDDVSIPYNGLAPLTGQAGKGSKDIRSKKTNIAKLAKSDNKELLEPKDISPGK